MNYSIFDVDGTILDSMEVWNTLASQYVQSLGMVPEKNLDEIVSDMSLEQSATYLCLGLKRLFHIMIRLM